jgi:hypothetical protein
MVIRGSSLKLCGHHAPTSSTRERHTISTGAAIRTSAWMSNAIGDSMSGIRAIMRSFLR